jgi:hypothetical protein
VIQNFQIDTLTLVARMEGQIKALASLYPEHVGLVRLSTEAQQVVEELKEIVKASNTVPKPSES